LPHSTPVQVKNVYKIQKPGRRKKKKKEKKKKKKKKKKE
jgi:hypothetical protein